MCDFRDILTFAMSVMVLALSSSFRCSIFTFRKLFKLKKCVSLECVKKNPIITENDSCCTYRWQAEISADEFARGMGSLFW